MSTDPEDIQHYVHDEGCSAADRANTGLEAEVARLRALLAEVYHEWDTADGEVGPTIMERVKAESRRS
jgi:hypothetical protein